MSTIYGSTLPRLWTADPAGALSWGPAVVALGRAAGWEPLPWQEFALNRGMLWDLRRQRWIRRDVCILCARQNGKNEVAIWRIVAGLALGLDRHTVIVGADRAVTFDTFAEVAKLFSEVPFLARRVRRIREANGQERIELVDGSRVVLRAMNSGGRGLRKVDLLVTDEWREWRDLEAERALYYTQNSSRSPQRWGMSNAGDDGSVSLNRVRDRGRATIEDPSSPIGWLEWSAPDGCALTDPEALAAANPSLGRVVDLENLLAQAEGGDPAGFRTEVLCQWVPKLGSWVDVPSWERLARPGIRIDPGPRCWMGIDITPARTRADLVVATEGPDGRYWVGIAETFRAPGGLDEDALTTRVDAWCREYRPLSIGYDPYTAGMVGRRLEAARWPARSTSGRDWVQSCQALWSAVVSDRLAHPNDPDLTSHVLAAARKDVGDGGWRLVRMASDRPISAAIALALAVGAAETTPAFSWTH